MCKKGNTTLQLGPTSNNQPSLTLLICNASHHRRNKGAERSGAALFCPSECDCYVLNSCLYSSIILSIE